MKKYCIIARNLSSKAGGIAVYGRNLIKELKYKGFDVCISPQEKGLFPLSSIKWLLIDTPLFLFKTDADIYHAIGIIEGMVLPILKPKDKKYITIHDLIPLKYKGNGFRKKFERFLVRIGLFLARFYDWIFTVSHLTKVDTVRFGSIDETKIKVVYQPIHEKFLKTPIVKKKRTTFNIGYISRMEEYKRHELLIREFMKYPNPNARLYLAGTGALFKKIKESIKSDNRIIILGFVPDDKLVEFYDILDVYVHTSKYEGWGLPIIEAILREKPAIVIRDTELPQEVKDICLVTDNLPVTFTQLYENRKILKKLSKRQKKRALSLLSPGH
ncbi:glycosyltransferase [Thermococcus barophilus]|uniref:Glycosyl transferase n=1 Tax=Thermococcus barophilus TaxID=55802 RepID=A0A0S1XEC6_THEBA|nr:glycosyltransferase [Thermococcus barophilus]ALM76148.1 Glycosyl transferase [Thermococcus barophilus]